MTRLAPRYPFEREFLELVATLRVLADQPAGLIHGEINPANSVLSPNDQLTLVDWDQAGRGPLLLEAGDPLLTAFLTEDLRFRQDSAVAFYDDYTDGVGMTEADRNLAFTAALLHALRYLRFGNPETRWARIRYALTHRDELLSAIPSRHIR